MSTPCRAALLVLSLAATSACTEVSGITCSTDSRPALMVDVRDSVTNLPAGQGARIIARTGTVADTADTREYYAAGYGLASERPGTYTLTVEQDGYRPWSRSGIEVTEDVCHVRTVQVTARLQRTQS
jgi:hypothetical protein